MTYMVVQEHDDGRDEIVADGFLTQQEAWDWAADFALYHAKRYRRYAFLTVRSSKAPAGPPPRIPHVYNPDKRRWWQRLLDLNDGDRLA